MTRIRIVDAAQLLLAVVGLGLSAYTTVVHYVASVPLVCTTTGIVSCEQVLTSPQSMLFGVPLAVYGLIWFVVVIAISAARIWMPERAATSQFGRASLVWTLGGAAAVVYFVYLEFGVIGKICLWCTGVHIVTLLYFLIEIIMRQTPVVTPESAELS